MAKVRVDPLVPGNLVKHNHGAEDLISGYVALSPTSSNRNVIQPTGDYIPLTVKANGTVAQTANLTEWQNSSGTVLAQISSAGYYTQTHNNPSNGTVVYSVLSEDSDVYFNITRTNVTTRKELQFVNSASGTGYPTFRLYAMGGGVDLKKYVLEADPVNGSFNFSTINDAQNTARKVFKIKGYASGGVAILENDLTTAVPLTVKAASSQTANLTEWQNSSGTVLTYVDPNGYLAVNGIPGDYTPAVYGNLSWTVSPAAGRATSFFKMTANNNADSNYTHIVQALDGRVTGSNKCIMRGTSSDVWINGTDTANEGTGGFYSARVYQNGVANVLTGFSGLIEHGSSGNVTTARAAYLRATKTGAGAITNLYGLYIEDINVAATLNYAIYTNAGKVRFGDDVTTTGSITAASFVLTSPDGTQWRVGVADDGALITSKVGTPLGLTLLLTS